MHTHNSRTSLIGTGSAVAVVDFDSRMNEFRDLIFEDSVETRELVNGGNTGSDVFCRVRGIATRPIRLSDLRFGFRDADFLSLEERKDTEWEREGRGEREMEGEGDRERSGRSTGIGRGSG